MAFAVLVDELRNTGLLVAGAGLVIMRMLNGEQRRSNGYCPSCGLRRDPNPHVHFCSGCGGRYR
jgi:hypothetical protein